MTAARTRTNKTMYFILAGFCLFLVFANPEIVVQDAVKMRMILFFLILRYQLVYTIMFFFAARAKNVKRFTHLSICYCSSSIATRYLDRKGPD